MQSIDLDSDAKVKVTDDTEVRKLRQWRISNYCLHRYACMESKQESCAIAKMTARCALY